MTHPAPQVSVILPTYNRGDVLLRAIGSIQVQTFTDWELLVIDDGSTDDSVMRVNALGDPRIRVLQQANQGVYTARNTGLAASLGQWLTFMDSDDEWLPHFLSLTTAFLRHHPDADWVTTEFLEDLGDGSPRIRHDLHDICRDFVPFARRIGSTALALPPGETDDYLRVYQRREPVGEWGRAIVDGMGAPDAQVYHGHIFDAMRWGYLNWLPITLLTRRALERVGPFTTHTRSAADYRFLSRLAQQFEAHMVAVPGAIKYDKAAPGQALVQGHLATGAASYRFEVNKLGFFDELFHDPAPRDAELARLRRHFCLATGHRALSLGLRREAIGWLRGAAAWEPILWTAWPMGWLARLVPVDRVAAKVYNGWLTLWNQRPRRS
ncbi:MAG: glycosyltransferase family 2 protein [Sphaerotilus sp.]|nr:glycosyltransferase family 2 protein [Sphaerotilus sp.]